MTITEQIAQLTAEAQALRDDYTVPSHEKRERLSTITDLIAALYGRRNQEDADRRAVLADRQRRQG